MMLPELEQIARETGEFFTSYKPLALTAVFVVPAAIGYGVCRLFYNPTADRYFGKIANGLFIITGGERKLRKKYGSNPQNPEQLNLF